MKTYVLYHNQCHDGFGAYWSAYLHFQQKAEYIAVQHGEPLPDLEPRSEVYIFDFCYPRKLMQELVSLHRVHLFDHHFTAQKEIEGIENLMVECVFDMNRSGAMLAWNHFFPNLPVPKLIQYLQDRDLWLWQLPYSRAISAFIRSYEMHLNLYSNLHLSLKNKDTFQSFVEQGQAILRSEAAHVAIILMNSHLVECEGHVVPQVNASCLMSEVGEALLVKYPDSIFSMYYYDEAHGVRHWGLRSRPSEDFDVSTIAKIYGGGGHKHAAGFTTELRYDPHFKPLEK